MFRYIIFIVFIIILMNILVIGMVFEILVLLVDEKCGEVSINIKNIDDYFLLFYIIIVDLFESNKLICLILIQFVICVEVG